MALRTALRATLLVALAALVTGCAATQPADGDAPLRVVASMTVVADFVEQVGGDRVAVESLVPTGGDPHTHEPTPADARLVADADLVVGNGVGLEPWFDRLATGGDEVLMAGEAVADQAVDDGDGPDPHLWMVPDLAAGYVDAIARALSDLDPDGAATYRARAEAYADRLDALDEEIDAALGAIPDERRVLVTPHDAYAYFADAYDLEVVTVVGVSTEEEPSAGAVRRVVDEVRARQVPTIFVEATVDRTVIERIATEAGVEVGDELHGDSLGGPDSGAETYEDMLRANADALVDGLGP